jgi:hypothetical protein
MSDRTKDYDVLFICDSGCEFKLHYPPETLLSEIVEKHVDSQRKYCPVCGQAKANFVRIEQDGDFAEGIRRLGK